MTHVSALPDFTAVCLYGVAVTEWDVPGYSTPLVDEPLLSP